ncbi:malonyl-ACP O-methyltransferase BioC [Candidatus Fukatsuia endosymbiont of Tuberolachnus salignus]|uniref:malonyl-ACP O-methyltransferase BioC n=1 Tax=Candidatus Fukatsuia endosymbiont of Tuberolachnus salignus TaxID=3077957 RepID=UPI00313CCC10
MQSTVDKSSATDNIDKQAIAAAFSRAAVSYDSVAQLQQKTGKLLLRIGCQHPGTVVLDVGCGTGYFSQKWRASGKKVIALDLAEGMLQQARRQQAADVYLLADMEKIPLSDKKVDICFSNLAVQWCHSLDAVLAEWYRVTHSGGVILFSTLSAGSLDELRQAWQSVDGYHHVNDFLTLSQIHVACSHYPHHLHHRLQQLFFPDVVTLMRSLQGIGATHLHHGRKQGLTGRQRLTALQAAYPSVVGRYPLSYQLVYGVIYRD